MVIPDQKQLWNKKHGAGDHEVFRNEPTSFAKIVEPKLKRTSKILELGCGIARDAAFFASHGHKVLATDFSSKVINRNKQIFGHSGLRFDILDISKPYEFKDGSFDVVYSHLSLHYYSDESTKKIFKEVARVLKLQGIFAFACKTPDDPNYGDGQEAEPGLFVSNGGHARHFFNESYARQLLRADFQTGSITEIKEQYGTQYSAFIRCIAKKK